MHKTTVAEDQRRILAMGGSFPAQTPASKVFMKHALKLSGQTNPRVLWVGTAWGDSADMLLWFYESLNGIASRPSVLPFLDRTPRHLCDLVLNQDVVFIGGGVSKAALAVWREYGFDEVLKEGWRRGVVMAGASFGAMCWFEQIISDSYTGEMAALEGLGIIKDSCCAHYEKRKPAYFDLIRAGKLDPGIGIEDGCALEITGTNQVRALCAQPGFACYQVSHANGAVSDALMAMTYLS